MALPEVNNRFLDELLEMGFPIAQARRAVQSSGNSSIEAAINWIFYHKNDPDVDEMPLDSVNIDIEGPNPSSVSEHVKLKAKELRDQAPRRKEEEENKTEREREKKRIHAGKELQEIKKIAEENERKHFIASRKTEKKEEKKAREKIRQKLRQDKVERRSRLGSSPEDPTSLKDATPLKQEEKELLPSKSVKWPIQPTTQLESMRNCLRFLRRQNKHEDAKVKRAFQTLLIYVRNVVNNPSEEKFRKIRVANPAFQARVGIFKESIEFLELCGFERVENGKFLFLPKDKVDITVLRSAGVLLQSAIGNPFFGLLSI